LYQANHKFFPFLNREQTLADFDIWSIAYSKNCFDHCCKQSQDVKLVNPRSQDIINVDVSFEASVKILYARIQQACYRLDKFTDVNILILPFKHVKEMFML
jgi:hypothetical protein